MKSKTLKKKIWSAALNYLMFFGIIAFVITCTFLIAFEPLEVPEELVRAFAPVAFYNIFILATFFTAIDFFRRKMTVERPVREIQKVLYELMNGNFKARIHIAHEIDRDYQLKEVAESINLLAKELGSVETLRTDFIANVSHELKTPLAVMQNYGTMLQKKGISEETRMEYAKAITETSRRLASLITNILKLNKLENQQIFPTVEEYDLGEQLCECLLQFENVWEDKDLEIETDLEDEVRITSDGELLSLVWNNLLSNAMKFTEAGGRVALSMKTDGEFVVVQVTDSGCGMTPEVGAHIFEKFYQGDTSHATKGNGLGLALVKRVVDIVQGEIRVESTLGKGSTFTVRLRKK